MPAAFGKGSGPGIDPVDHNGGAVGQVAGRGAHGGHDGGAKQDKATLYKRLDGLTPTEIIEKNMYGR